MNKNVFIDCGAHNGCSVRHFFATFDKPESYEIHSFECNPKLFDQLTRSTAHHKNVTTHNNAVWIENKDMDFFIGQIDAGSTLMKSKTTGNINLKSPLTVKAINLAEFIRTNFDENDNIVLKLDIEGAEYEVLKHLASTDTLRYVKQLHGEWHWHKIRYTKQQHDEVVKLLQNASLELINWNAL